MSETVTRGIRVQVQATYVTDKSAPADSYYFFAYTVRITNEGPETAQLISRRWVISGPEGEIGQVEGPGVVGQQPVLEPGRRFNSILNQVDEAPDLEEEARQYLRQSRGG